MSDTRLFYWSIIALFAFLIVLLISAGWTNFNDNHLITECIRAGKIWKDGNCVPS